MNWIDRENATMLLDAASTRITHPRMQLAFEATRNEMEIFELQLDELDRVVDYVNQREESDFLPDMTNTRIVKAKLNHEEVLLPTRTQPESYRQRAANYNRTLRVANAMMGSYFTFQDYASDPVDCISAAIMDGYALYTSLLVKWPPTKFINLLTNMQCEVTAHLKNAQPNKSSFLFESAKTLGWFNPDYGYSKFFLVRHGLAPSDILNDEFL